MEDRFGNVYLMATYQSGDVTDVGGDDSDAGDVDDRSLVDKVKDTVGNVKAKVGNAIDKAFDRAERQLAPRTYNTIVR